MVHLLQCISSSVPHMPFFFFLLLLTSSMEVAAFSDATRRRPLTRLAVAAEPGAGEPIAAAKELALARQQQLVRKGNGRALIGSRPPRCERACMSCGHCEAVQVPIVPQMRKAAATDDAAAAVTAAMFRFRYSVDGIANYKPLSWKCRCGGTILDP